MNQKTVTGHGFFRKSKAYGLVCGIALGLAFLGGQVSADSVSAPQTDATTAQVAPAQSETKPAMTSDIPTSVPATISQDQAVTAVDAAQATLKDSVTTAKAAGVVVKEGDTQEVVINDGNASAKTSEVLTDLNQQDKAVKEATAKQVDNQKAYEETSAKREAVVKAGQDSLTASTAEVDHLIAQAKKAGLLVSETTKDKTPTYTATKGLTGDDLRQAMAANLSLYQEAIKAGISLQGKSVTDLKQALALSANNQKAYQESLAQREAALAKGQEALKASTGSLDQVIKTAKQAGITVTESTSQTKPDYKAVQGLTGDALRQAMTANLALYQEALKAGIALQGKSTEDVKRALALHQTNQTAYTDTKLERDKAVSTGQASLQKATKALDDQIALAKKNDLTVTESTSDQTPKYHATKGLTGDALRAAMAENIKLYNDTVKRSVGFVDQSTADMKKQIDAYLQALSNYQKGVATNTGLKWQNGVDLLAGVGAQKMTGQENVIDEGDGTLRTAAMYATQSVALSQNIDANFDNIFKINGRGTIYVKNTTNGDVALTFSDINSPYTTGTYVAIWGDNNGGIAWSVFSTYSGVGTSSGAGEATTGTGGTGVGGRILNYVYAYTIKTMTSNDVSVVTYNDVDNKQTIVVMGLDGAKVDQGKNITASGNSYSAGSGDVSQGSAGVLDSNGVRWTFAEAKQQDFTVVHSVDGKNTSIVGGIFGAASEVPKVPVKPTLSAKKATVTAPSAPDTPAKLSVTVKKVTVAFLEAPTAPKPVTVAVQKARVGIPDAPEAPRPIEVSVHTYKLTTTPTPVQPTPQPPKPVVQKGNVLPETGEASGGLAVLGGVLLAGLSLVGLGKRKEG